MTPRVSRVVRLFGWLAYAGFVAVVFVVSAYLAFSLFVRSGATPAPELLGLDEQQAAATLSDDGLAIRIAEGAGRYDATVPAGRVLGQQPEAGTLVKRGSAVQVVLSLGPQRLVVPDLAGRSLQTAQVSLAALGLATGSVLQIYRDDASPGTVVEQEPPAGATVDPSVAVDLVVALGSADPTYVMPDLVYRDYQRVRSYFQHQGFRFGNVKFEPYEGVALGVILRQFPVAGHPLSKSDTISLVVAGPDAPAG